MQTIKSGVDSCMLTDESPIPEQEHDTHLQMNVRGGNGFALNIVG